MEAETPQPCREDFSRSHEHLKTSFINAWNSKTVESYRAVWISRLNPQEVFRHYERFLTVDTFGTPLDTLPIEDVYKAVKVISNYSEMTHSYAVLLDKTAFGQRHQKRFSEVLYSFLQRQNLEALVGFCSALNHFGKMEKYLKWVTALLWAKSLRQKELPPMPDFLSSPECGPFELLSPSCLWKSTFYGHISQLDCSFLSTFTKDLYNCKGAAASVGPEFIQEALQKHKDILTTPKTAPSPFGELGEDRLLSAITETAASIFGYGITGKVERKPPSRFPSLNSSFSSKRSQGGAGGEILRKSDDCCDFYSLQPEDGYFWGFASHNCEVFEVRTPYDPEIWREAEILSEKRAIATALSGYGVDAEVIPLSEPFKVRTITKGDCDMYHLARRWQKVIHSKMRKNPRSALMGQPCSGPFLAKTFLESPWFDYSNQSGFFVSGDYESATDLLNPDLSIWAQNEISNRLRIPFDHQKVLNACLTEHNLYYGEKDEHGNKITYKQTWGQLMGSPVSFPVLCLINLAATKLAYEVYFEQKTGKKVRMNINELPMSVNGDDILFWCHSSDHYQIWKDITANAGLKFSLGKNYTSRKYCIINSEMYRFHLSESLPFHKIPCINTRLLQGGSRSTVTSTFPLHKDDSHTLISDPLFKKETHLKRFCHPQKKRRRKEEFEKPFLQSK